MTEKTESRRSLSIRRIMNYTIFNDFLEVTVSDIRNDKGNILVMAKVAGQEQVVSVIDVQGVGRISRARVDQLVALRIPGSTILQVVLVVAALLIFVVSGYFLGHFDHSF